MSNVDGAAVRAAAERIMAERQRWDGVGLLAIENLETGACGLFLVPSSAPRPDWGEELRIGAPGWEQHEDVSLAQWLQRWARDAGAAAVDARWGEWMNLLNLHAPAPLVAALPAASRRLACGHGLGVHALPPAEGTSALLGRLVAWLLPWERLAIGDGRHACAHWLGPQGVQQQWLSIGLADGAGARTRADRESAGGMVEWGVLAAWPSAVDAVVAFLLAQADALDAAPSVPTATGAKPAVRRIGVGSLSKDRRNVVLVAVHEVLNDGFRKERPGQDRQDAAFEWARRNESRNVHAALVNARADWCPKWYGDRLRDEHGTAVIVADLLGAVGDLSAFRRNVRKGMKEKQRNEPAVLVPFAAKGTPRHTA